MSEETDLVEGANAQGTTNYNEGGTPRESLDLADMFTALFQGLKNIFGGSGAQTGVAGEPPTPSPTPTPTPTPSPMAAMGGGMGAGMGAGGGVGGIPPQIRLAMAKQRMQGPQQTEDMSGFMKGARAPGRV